MKDEALERTELMATISFWYGKQGKRRDYPSPVRLAFQPDINLFCGYCICLGDITGAWYEHL
jgi:hypothetical protein